jgi:hypothetical protein
VSEVPPLGKTLVVTAMVMLVCVAGAVAAAGTLTISLGPNKAGKASTLHVVATGPFRGVTGLPKSVIVYVQRGFKVDARAVAVECTAAQASSSACPASSNVGSGNSSVHVVTSVGTGTGDYTVNLKLFLGHPQQAGDVASVVLEGSVQTIIGTTKLNSATGRLVAPASGPYGLELVFAKFPTVALPSGITATFTLNKLTMNTGAHRAATVGTGVAKHKVTYSLITNPRKCMGSWSARLTSKFGTGSLSIPTAAPCRK